MPTIEELKALAQQIAAQFKGVQRVILFGSHARGEAGPDSDVDLMVLMDFEGHPVYQAAAIYNAIGVQSFPMDILVRTPQKFLERCQMVDWFMREVRDQGKVLYEA